MSPLILPFFNATSCSTRFSNQRVGSVDEKSPPRFVYQIWKPSNKSGSKRWRGGLGDNQCACYMETMEWTNVFGVKPHLTCITKCRVSISVILLSLAVSCLSGIVIRIFYGKWQQLNDLLQHFAYLRVFLWESIHFLVSNHSKSFSRHATFEFGTLLREETWFITRILFRPLPFSNLRFFMKELNGAKCFLYFHSKWHTTFSILRFRVKICGTFFKNHSQSSGKVVTSSFFRSH